MEAGKSDRLLMGERIGMRFFASLRMTPHLAFFNELKGEENDLMYSQLSAGWGIESLNSTEKR